ncbi:MAG: MotA/TolQ/ExbB proton channel family protein [Phycisphaerales bacterium]|nr:MotA/TolQ/ExbB proton channel family protein [Phycisphaerales bacterium]
MVERLFYSFGMMAMQGAGAAAAGGAGPPNKTLVQYIAEGGQIGYIIVGLSFTAVVFIIAAVVRLRRARLAPEADVSSLDRMLRAGSLEQAIAYCSSPDHDSFLTRVMGAALLRCSRSPFGLLELRTALEETGQTEVARLHRSTDAIGLIASVAPMLGLLGTVVGMVGAFDTLSVSQGVAKPDQLAGSISVALITTVLGLVVAIPCTAVYAYLRNRIDALVSEVGDLIEELASHVEQGASPAQPGAPGPARAAPPRPAPAAQGVRTG